jgi:hypothetical protein
MARYQLPALKTYEEAAKHEAQVVPIRGRSPECKPIGDRKDTHFTIRREVDGSIIAKCYRSDLIRWYPDGRIFITNGGYTSTTTHDFIGRLLGPTRWNSICSTSDGETWIRTRDGVFPLAKDGQFFKWDPEGRHLVAETPNYPTTHTINKPAMREARKEIAPFVKYFNNIMKLTQWAPMEGSKVFLGTDRQVHAHMVGEDTEKWAFVLAWLVQTGTVSRHEYKPNPTGGYTYKTTQSVSKAIIQDRITRVLLRTHRSKVLIKKTHTDGTWRKDAYKAFADA